MALTRRTRQGAYIWRQFLAVTRRRILASEKSDGVFIRKNSRRPSALSLLNEARMSAAVPTSVCEVPNTVAQTLVRDRPGEKPQTKVWATWLNGIKRRFVRERRRRKVGRAYDMALEIARVLPRRAEVLDVGCGNGYIAHHLSAILGTTVAGIDVMETTEAPINYRRYDGRNFPVKDSSIDAVLFCYVLHHAQDAGTVLKEVRRVMRDDGVVLIYEDIPRTWWDQGVCWIHNRQWKDRTGPCTFRRSTEWRRLFNSSGFAIAGQRRLSRWRNWGHPVCRTLYTLRLK